MNLMTLKERKMEWISVKDRLPDIDKDGELVLYYEFNNEIGVGYLEDDKWYNYDSGWELDKSVVTHWMPLPEPPKEQ